MQTTATLSAAVLKKAIDRYYKELHDYKGRADYELAVRTAFLNLLAETARQVKWMLIPEQTIEGGIRPDGVLRDSFDLKRGFCLRIRSGRCSFKTKSVPMSTIYTTRERSVICSPNSSPTPSLILPPSRWLCKSLRSGCLNWHEHC